MARWKILARKGDIPERYEARGNEFSALKQEEETRQITAWKSA